MKNLSEIVELLVQYIPFVTITVLNAVLPIIFQKLVQFEDYRYEFGFKLTLARYFYSIHVYTSVFFIFDNQVSKNYIGYELHIAP